MSSHLVVDVPTLSLVAFIGTAFGLYRLLVKQKDATIETLKETNKGLQLQMDGFKLNTPDILAESLSKRAKLLQEELGSLVKDKSDNDNLIKSKEDELHAAKIEIKKLQDYLHRAQNILSEFSCPDCMSPLSNKGIDIEYGYYDSDLGGQVNVNEVMFRHEVTTYNCGMKLVDGVVSIKCPNSVAGETSS